MRVINFDERYIAYVQSWIAENKGRFRDADDMEEHAVEACEHFAHTKADWLDGYTPETYFERFTDPMELVDGLRAYEDAQVNPPEWMLRRIVALGKPAVPSLMALAADESACACLRATALRLLGELESEDAKALCLRLIDAGGDEELVNAAADLLQGLGEAAVGDMLKHLPDASDEAACVYIDLLCNFPGDERIYVYTERAFLRNVHKRALLSNCLAKLGDTRAIPVLRRVMEQEDVDYLAYLEIANAIEALGGDAGARDRVFDGDDTYESLKNL